MVVVFIILDWMFFFVVEYNYHDSLQSYLIEGMGHSPLYVCVFSFPGSIPYVPPLDMSNHTSLYFTQLNVSVIY